MSLPTAPEIAHDASKTLQHQLYYSGEILEIAFDSLRGYKEQSIACVSYECVENDSFNMFFYSYLDSTVHLAYLLLKMLERWATTQGEIYVRKRQPTKKKTVKSRSISALTFLCA